MEVACYHTAVERGYWNVSNAYRAKDKKAAEKWEKYSQARQAKNSVMNSLMRTSLMRTSLVGIRKPREIS